MSGKMRRKKLLFTGFLESVVFEVVENYLERLKEVNVSDELNEMKKQKMLRIEKEQKRIAKETDKKQGILKLWKMHCRKRFGGKWNYC